MQNNFFSNSIIIDILEKPSKKSNISSQIIYGEKFKVIKKDILVKKLKLFLNLRQLIKLKFLNLEFMSA